jgi:hypothetical protein
MVAEDVTKPAADQLCDASKGLQFDDEFLKRGAKRVVFGQIHGSQAEARQIGLGKILVRVRREDLDRIITEVSKLEHRSVSQLCPASQTMTT